MENWREIKVRPFGDAPKESVYYIEDKDGNYKVKNMIGEISTVDKFTFEMLAKFIAKLEEA